MAGDLPSRRIDRDALDRIIRRAAELQAGEIDTGEAITEQDLLKLGADVGIDGRFLRQAMYEEHAGAVPAERGLLARWIGPGRVAAGRVVPGDKASVEQALEHWMTESEALTVKRRLPDRTLWERQKGFFAEMKRGLGVGGKSYQLAKAHEVAVAVTQLEAGFCHVELSADISDARGRAAASGGMAAGTLGALGFMMIAILAGPPALVVTVALVPLGAAAAALPLATRQHRRRAGRTQLALEQVLDRLERGEIKPQHRSEPRGMFAFGRVAFEIRRAITEASEASRRPPRRLPPTT
jgi:hypothetical protein